MSITALIKSIFHHSDPSEETMEAIEEEPEQEKEGSIIPSLNRGMPVEIMSDFDTVLLAGRLVEASSTGLTVARIPGEISFPTSEIGSIVLVRGYNAEMNPIIMQGKVIRSSMVECAVGDLRINDYINQRRDIRYSLKISANIYTQKDAYFKHPQPCRLLNISTGGACIESEHSYALEQILRLRVELIKKSGHTTYPCQVVRIVERGDGRFEYGLLFAQLDRKKIYDLTKDIQDIRKDIEKKLLS